MQCNGMNAKQCNAMQCNAKQCNAKQCIAKQYIAKQCNAKQCNAKHLFLTTPYFPLFTYLTIRLLLLLLTGLLNLLLKREQARLLLALKMKYAVELLF